jgi:hypothetical protein
LILTTPQNSHHEATEMVYTKSLASESFCNEKEFYDEKQNLCLLKAEEYILRKTFWDELVAVKNQQLSVEHLRLELNEIIAQTDSPEFKNQLKEYLEVLEVHFPKEPLGVSILSQR